MTIPIPIPTQLKDDTFIKINPNNKNSEKAPLEEGWQEYNNYTLDAPEFSEDYLVKIEANR